MISTPPPPPSPLATILIPWEALDTDEEPLRPCWPEGPSSIPEVFLLFLSSLEHTLFPFAALWYAGSPSIQSPGWSPLRSHLCCCTWVTNEHTQAASRELSSAHIIWGKGDVLIPSRLTRWRAWQHLKLFLGVSRWGRGCKCLKPQPSSNST